MSDPTRQLNHLQPIPTNCTIKKINPLKEGSIRGGGGGGNLKFENMEKEVIFHILLTDTHSSTAD